MSFSSCIPIPICGQKLRPAVVVQADNLQTGIPQIILAMITSRIDRGGHPSRIVITGRDSDWQRTGLLRDSVVMTDNLATVHESAIDRRIGVLATPTIDAALRYTFGL